MDRLGAQPFVQRLSTLFRRLFCMKCVQKGIFRLSFVERLSFVGTLSSFEVCVTECTEGNFREVVLFLSVLYRRFHCIRILQFICSIQLQTLL